MPGPEDPKSDILLPLGAVPGFGVLFRALFAPDGTPKDRPSEMPEYSGSGISQETGAPEGRDGACRDRCGSYQFGDTIEGPSLLSLSDGWFVLFVAHGNYGTCGYSTEWFKSQHPWSWTQTGGTTILSQSQDGLCGPGGADVSDSEVSGQYRLFFHAYASGTPGTAREMYADVLTIGSDGYTPQLSALAPAS